MTERTMRERLARKWCLLDGFAEPEEDWRRSVNGEQVCAVIGIALAPGQEQRWRTYLGKVDVLLTELEKPTEAVIEVGEEAYPDDQYGKLSVRRIFECMVRAIREGK